jgi:hypothetical protein
MFKALIRVVMETIGFRRVLYLPSEKGLFMADFYCWEWAPDLEKKLYTEKTFPFERYY